MIEGALFHMLKNDADVSSLVADRIYPDVIPQEIPLPAVLLSRTPGDGSVHSTTGFSGVIRARFSVLALCEYHAEAVDLAAKIRSLLDGYSGRVLGVEIQGIFLQDFADLPAIDPQTKIQTAMARRAEYRVIYSLTE